MGQVWVKIRRKGFLKSFEPGAIWEGEVFCLPTIWVDKRREVIWSGKAIMPTFSALCFQPRNAQIAADIAEWFPAALWLDVELQPFLAWFLTLPCSSTERKQSKSSLAEP